MAEAAAKRKPCVKMNQNVHRLHLGGQDGAGRITERDRMKALSVLIRG